MSIVARNLEKLYKVRLESTCIGHIQVWQPAGGKEYINEGDGDGVYHSVLVSGQPKFEATLQIKCTWQ